MMSNGETTEHEAMTNDALFAKYHKRAILLAILGDYSGTALLRVASMVWYEFPALFPDVATAILECDNARTAGWVIREMFKDVPGGWDIWVASRDIGYGAAA
jgi:hypothetical protein